LVTDDEVRWRHYPGWGDGLREALTEDVEVVAIDIPIGLPRLGETRPCDAAARKWLGPRRSSVFSAPPRELLGCRSYAEALARSRELTGRGISAQAYGIYPRIAAVDEVVAPADQRRLVEGHPEIGFMLLAGDLGSKHHAAGRQAREAALRAVLPPFDLRDKPRGVAVDDALDALACAWIARRWCAGTAILLPPQPIQDDRGLWQAVGG
jgi:predicted RNase H-like nuclease